MNVPLLKSAKNLKNKRVLLRADFNVPIGDGVVLDDFRIKKIIPTIQFLKDAHAEVILLSHHSDAKQSLHPVARYLNSEHFKTYFIEDIYDAASFEKAREISAKAGAHILFCENLRKWPGETANGHSFAEHLASLGDAYVNDAFSASHREHASIVTLPTLLPSYAGLLFEEEVKNLSRVFAPPHPSLLILGGAKAAAKLSAAERLLPTVDALFIGGALAHNFFHMLGREIGMSVFEKSGANLNAMLSSGKLRLPLDVIVQNEGGVFTKNLHEVKPQDKILDAGPATLKSLEPLVSEARFIVWNGPLGDYTVPGFEKGSVRLIEILARSKAKIIAGGGDSVALITREKREDAFDFLSTAGGAMLAFLSERTLPGIRALAASS